MRRLWPLLVILVLLAVLAGLGVRYAWTNPEVVEQLLVELELRPPAVQGISGSGFIEALQVDVAAEVGGRILDMPVSEGQEVRLRDVLVELDTELLDAQIRQAEAAVEAAKAQLARAQAGARPEEIRQAEAAVAQAEAARDAAEQAWKDAIAVRDNPQQLELQIAEARTELEAAQRELEQALAAKDAAEEQRKQADILWKTVTSGFDVEVTLPDGSTVTQHVDAPREQVRQVGTQHGLATDQWWTAWTAVELAQVRVEGAQRHLDNLLAMRDNPLQQQAQVDAARAEYEAARAAVEAARAQLALVEAGPTAEQVRQAEAAVQQAEAQLQSLQIQREKMTLYAPIYGIVAEQVAEVGETAAPGATLLRLADLDPVTLTIYVPEADLGQVRVGGRAEVRVDAFPREVFEGQVVFIAPEAEFTPKNVQTREGRTSLVFAVKVRIPNPEGKLKPGMPADAIITEEALTLSGAATRSSSAAATDRIEASGSVEARSVAVTAELGGRVREILVAEGDRVSPGEVLIRLDTDLLESQMREAEAALQAARAQLDQVRAGARPEEVAVAEAQLAQAVALRDGARKAWEDAQALLQNPQELDDQIDQARTAVALAKAGVEQAKAQLHAGRVRRDGYPNPSSEYAAAQHEVEAAEAALAAAQARYRGAQEALDQLLAMREEPLELQAAVNQARAAYVQAETGVQAAQAALDRLRAGPTAEEIAVAEAGVRQAEAALEVLRVQIDKMTLRSPVEGLVASQAIQVGEIAQPGATLLTLADLDQVTVRIFVPETQIGQVHLGQSVQVSVDAFPGRTFEGRVSFIAPEAEFTPRNVQTKEQRANLVFAVKISVPNPDHALKPGMPADVVIQPGGRE